MKNSEDTIKHLREAFKQRCLNAGVKYTRQRLIIYSVLVQDENHSDAQAIYEIVRRRIKNISLDTVYRTLWLFKNLGWIKTLGPGREKTRFDPNLEPHHHFICTRCGKIADFTSEEMDTLDLRASVENLGSVENLQVNIQGICRDCESRP